MLNFTFSCLPENFAPSIIYPWPPHRLLPILDPLGKTKLFHVSLPHSYSYFSISILLFTAINFQSIHFSPSMTHNLYIINDLFPVYFHKQSINSIKAEIKLSCSRLFLQHLILFLAHNKWSKKTLIILDYLILISTSFSYHCHHHLWKSGFHRTTDMKMYTHQKYMVYTFSTLTCRSVNTIALSQPSLFLTLKNWRLMKIEETSGLQSIGSHSQTQLKWLSTHTRRLSLVTFQGTGSPHVTIPGTSSLFPSSKLCKLWEFPDSPVVRTPCFHG